MHFAEFDRIIRWICRLQDVVDGGGIGFSRHEVRRFRNNTGRKGGQKEQKKRLHVDGLSLVYKYTVFIRQMETGMVHTVEHSSLKKRFY